MMNLSNGGTENLPTDKKPKATKEKPMESEYPSREEKKKGVKKKKS